VVAKRK